MVVVESTRLDQGPCDLQLTEGSLSKGLRPWEMMGGEVIDAPLPRDSTDYWQT